MLSIRVETEASPAHFPVHLPFIPLLREIVSDLCLGIC
jgi:hypothetical protein